MNQYRNIKYVIKKLLLCRFICGAVQLCRVSHCLNSPMHLWYISIFVYNDLNCVKGSSRRANLVVDDSHPHGVLRGRYGSLRHVDSPRRCKNCSQILKTTQLKLRSLCFTDLQDICLYWRDTARRALPNVLISAEVTAVRNFWARRRQV